MVPELLRADDPLVLPHLGSVGRLGAAVVGWPDRARFEAALEHQLLPEPGELPLLGLLEADRK